MFKILAPGCPRPEEHGYCISRRDGYRLFFVLDGIQRVRLNAILDKAQMDGMTLKSPVNLVPDLIARHIKDDSITSLYTQQELILLHHLLDRYDFKFARRVAELLP